MLFFTRKELLPLGGVFFWFLFYAVPRITITDLTYEDSVLKHELRPRPGINKDTAFFWQGLKNGELLIQQCSDCQTLRHPPAPVCNKCLSFNWQTQKASGRGVIHSFVKMHHPQVPAFDHPNPIGLIELEEGTRLVGCLVGFAEDAIKIGTPVQLQIVDCDEQTSMAQFIPVTKATTGVN